MISKKDVEKVAKLARLEISEDEKEKYVQQLGAILQFVEKLNEVDTQGVEPTAQITGLENVMRKDEVSRGENREKLLSNAPQTEDGFIKVKAVLGGAEEKL